MSSIHEIRETTAQIPDQELRAVCLRIVDEVCERIGRDNLGLWTIEVISKWVRLPPSDVTLIRGIQLLASRRDAQLLQMHFIYFDPTVSDGLGEPIPDGEVRDAYSSGFLVDPTSGREVPNFEDFLLPYFEPAQGLVSR